MGTLGRFSLAPPPRCGCVLYVYLLAPYVLLDYLLVLDGVLANPYLFLDHRALLGDDLLLGHRHGDLVLADLCLRGLPALDRHPLYADLLVSGGHPYLLALGPHILADPHLTGFTLSGAGPKLFFGALYPKLLLVADAFSSAKIFFSFLAEMVFPSAFSSSCSLFVSIHACLLCFLHELLPRALYFDYFLVYPSESRVKQRLRTGTGVRS